MTKHGQVSLLLMGSFVQKVDTSIDLAIGTGLFKQE
jgi:hypothetical protein